MESAGDPRPRRLTILGRAFRNRDVRLVEAAFLAFNMGETATWIAILVFAYGIGGSVAAGLMAVIQLVPAALFAPFGSLLSDLYPRQRMIFFSYVAQAVAMAATAAALLLAAPLAVIYGLAAATSLTVTLVRPVQGGLLPMLVSTPDELVAANVAAGTIESVSMFSAPALTGLLLVLMTPGAVFAAMAAIEFVGALAVFHLDFRDTQSAQRRASSSGVGSSLREGFDAVMKNRDSRLVIAVIATHFVELGALDILFVVLALSVLHIGRSGVGFLNSAFGAGGVIGSGFGILLIGRKRLVPSLFVGAAAFGLALTATGVTSAVVVTVILLLICGSGRTLVDLTGRSLLQRVVSHDFLSRAFGALEGLAMAALAIGSILVPVLVTSVGIRVTLFVVGGILPVVILIGSRALRRLDFVAIVPSHQLAILRSLSLFSGLEMPVLERLAASLTVVEVPAGTVVFRQGDLGDRFYVIDDGTVEVRLDDGTAERLNAGDFFGEIALLRRIPRTATIAAATDARLFALEGDEFIEAVTGHAEARQSADRIMDERLGSRS